MTIRIAIPRDAQQAARLMYDALHDVAHQLTGAETEADAVEVLAYYFAQEKGRLSYKQAMVKELDGKVVGVVIAYAGADADVLDQPMLERLRKLHNDPTFTLAKEADEDEYYIDTLSVSPEYGGRGMGSELIQAVEQVAKKLGFSKNALVVFKDNPRAYALYQRSGYEADKEITIHGQRYDHMVKKL
ncbi:ribosomal protein S18 acetylase RimI-like enzyme [Paenibacillus sp. DS2015]|uniref:GNAT family N-acetyltransferase n=1 Tax=Paenibacillus sp. DS2015 TaxID=3373917 RepID=UPI003D1D9C11